MNRKSSPTPLKEPPANQGRRRPASADVGELLRRPTSLTVEGRRRLLSESTAPEQQRPVAIVKPEVDGLALAEKPESPPKCAKSPLRQVAGMDDLLAEVDKTMAELEEGWKDIPEFLQWQAGKRGRPSAEAEVEEWIKTHDSTTTALRGGEKASD